MTPSNFCMPQIGVLVSSLLLAACAAPTRAENPEAFAVVSEGRIPAAQSQAFADCLLDGFDKSHNWAEDVRSRQQRRTDSYRVETVAPMGILYASADVFDDGRIRLTEGAMNKPRQTQGEKETFSACVRQFSGVEVRRREASRR